MSNLNPQTFGADGTQTLVHFPVLFDPAGPVEPLAEAQMSEAIERTRALCTRTVADMRARGFGRVVLVAPSYPVLFPEVAAGWQFCGWLSGLTRGLALESAAQGVTVNAVLLGTTAAEEELRHAVGLFLERDAGYLTGQVMHLCGGKSMVSVFSH